MAEKFTLKDAITYMECEEYTCSCCDTVTKLENMIKVGKVLVTACNNYPALKAENERLKESIKNLRVVVSEEKELVLKFMQQSVENANEINALKARHDKAVELLREMDETGIIDHQAIAQFLGGE